MRTVAAASDAGLAGATLRQKSLFYTGILYLSFRCIEYWLFGGEPFEMDGGAGSQVYQITVILISGIVILANRPWEDLRRLLVIPVSLVVAIAWCWLTVTWSIAPAISLRRIAQITIAVFVIFTVVTQLGYDRSLHMVRWCFAGVLLLCYLVLLIDPDKGIQLARTNVDPNGVGAWRGVFIDKNMCGAFCAATISLFVFDARKLPQWLRWLVVAAAVFFLYKTASKTAMGVQAGAFAMGLLFTRYNPSYRIFHLPLALCIIAGIAFFWRDMLHPFEQALYDPHAFTGRGPIWATLLSYLKENWLFGTGFSAFWAVPDSPALLHAEADWVRETVRVGHNGYLDLWVTIGLPGLLLVLIANVVVPFARILGSRYTTSGQASLIASLIVFILGQNVTESTLFYEKAFPTLILLIAVALSHMIGKPLAAHARRLLPSPQSQPRPEPQPLKPAATGSFRYKLK